MNSVINAAVYGYIVLNVTFWVRTVLQLASLLVQWLVLTGPQESTELRVSRMRSCPKTVGSLCQPCGRTARALKDVYIHKIKALVN